VFCALFASFALGVRCFDEQNVEHKGKQSRRRSNLSQRSSFLSVSLLFAGICVLHPSISISGCRRARSCVLSGVRLKRRVFECLRFCQIARHARAQASVYLQLTLVFDFGIAPACSSSSQPEREQMKLGMTYCLGYVRVGFCQCSAQVK
jgi:hypothetical protein